MYKAGLFSPSQQNHDGQQNQKINKKQKFKNLQIFQTDIQAEPWNPLKWFKKKKWTDYQNFTSDDAMYFPFFKFASSRFARTSDQKHHSDNLKFNK